MKRFFYTFCLAILMVSLLTGASTPPQTTFELVQGLPLTMTVGETQSVIVHVESDQEFLSIQALPSFQFPGKGVAALQGGDRSGRGTSATLELTFQAKSSTAEFPEGVAPVHVVVGVRYGGGLVVVQDYLFNVVVQ
jgi:hypothetical protein